MAFEQESPPSGQGAAAAVDGPDEFDTAFEEFASGGTPPADDAAGKTADDPDQVTPPVDAQPGSVAEAGPVTQAAGAPPPASDQSTDIWANAPAELREAHEAALRDADLRFSSVKGRLSAADRQLAQLREQQGRTAPQNEGTGQPSQDQPENPLKSEAITKLRDEYGEIAGPLVDTMERMWGELNSLKQPVQQLGQERHATHLNQQEALLASRHADWQQTVADERFAGWAQSQPRYIQEALARNADSIVDAEEAASVIGLYKVAIGAGATPPPPPPPPPPDPQVATTESRRQRQLDAGKDAGRSGSAPTTSGIPDDFDQAMDAYQSIRDRRERQSG